MPFLASRVRNSRWCDGKARKRRGLCFKGEISQSKSLGSHEAAQTRQFRTCLRIAAGRPRVRSRSGQEARLATVEHFQRVAPVPARVLNQILLGVSTRGYERSPCGGACGRADARDEQERGESPPDCDKLREQLSRRLDDLDLLVLMLDGVAIARRTAVVALGILADGRKVVLALWQGSTENAALCTSLLQNLLERGLKVDSRILCMIDGGRGIRKALLDVFGRSGGGAAQRGS